MADEKKEKKKVTVEASQAAQAGAPTWQPTPEAKSKALRFRLLAALLWAVAIGLEAVTVFKVLRPEDHRVSMWWLIGLIVAIGVFALCGSLLWKHANRLDPASEKDKTRFWVQNQLGVIVTVIAFLPLVVMILLNKDMSAKQKGIAGGVAAILAVAVGLASADFNPPSKEQYARETNIIELLTGKDEVVWTKEGKVFHVCDKVPDVNKESKDNTIYRGTVAAAHEAGKDRLTQRWELEAVNYCGYTQAQADLARAGGTDSVQTSGLTPVPPSSVPAPSSLLPSTAASAPATPVRPAA